MWKSKGNVFIQKKDDNIIFKPKNYQDNVGIYKDVELTMNEIYKINIKCHSSNKNQGFIYPWIATNDDDTNLIDEHFLTHEKKNLELIFENKYDKNLRIGLLIKNTRKNDYFRLKDFCITTMVKIDSNEEKNKKIKDEIKDENISKKTEDINVEVDMSMLIYGYHCELPNSKKYMVKENKIHVNEKINIQSLDKKPQNIKIPDSIKIKENFQKYIDNLTNKNKKLSEKLIELNECLNINKTLDKELNPNNIHNNNNQNYDNIIKKNNENKKEYLETEILDTKIKDKNVFYKPKIIKIPNINNQCKKKKDKKKKKIIKEDLIINNREDEIIKTDKIKEEKNINSKGKHKHKEKEKIKIEFDENIIQHDNKMDYLDKLINKVKYENKEKIIQIKNNEEIKKQYSYEINNYDENYNDNHDIIINNYQNNNNENIQKKYESNNYQLNEYKDYKNQFTENESLMNLEERHEMEIEKQPRKRLKIFNKKTNKTVFENQTYDDKLNMDNYDRYYDIQNYDYQNQNQHQQQNEYYEPEININEENENINKRKKKKKQPYRKKKTKLLNKINNIREKIVDDEPDQYIDQEFSLESNEYNYNDDYNGIDMPIKELKKSHVSNRLMNIKKQLHENKQNNVNTNDVNIDNINIDDVNIDDSTIKQEQQVTFKPPSINFYDINIEEKFNQRSRHSKKLENIKTQLKKEYEPSISNQNMEGMGINIDTKEIDIELDEDIKPKKKKRTYKINFNNKNTYDPEISVNENNKIVEKINDRYDINNTYDMDITYDKYDTYNINDTYSRYENPINNEKLEIEDKSNEKNNEIVKTGVKSRYKFENKFNNCRIPVNSETKSINNINYEDITRNVIKQNNEDSISNDDYDYEKNQQKKRLKYRRNKERKQLSRKRKRNENNENLDIEISTLEDIENTNSGKYHINNRINNVRHVNNKQNNINDYNEYIDKSGDIGFDVEIDNFENENIIKKGKKRYKIPSSAQPVINNDVEYIDPYEISKQLNPNYQKDNEQLEPQKYKKRVSKMRIK